MQTAHCYYWDFQACSLSLSHTTANNKLTFYFFKIRVYKSCGQECLRSQIMFLNSSSFYLPSATKYIRGFFQHFQLLFLMFLLRRLPSLSVIVILVWIVIRSDLDQSPFPTSANITPCTIPYLLLTCKGRKLRQKWLNIRLSVFHQLFWVIDQVWTGHSKDPINNQKRKKKKDNANSQQSSRGVA